jgi:glycosyltransferase involved in cell wall biosynthesis
MRSLLVREQDAFTHVMLYLRTHAAQFDLLHNHSFSGLPLLLSSLHGLPMVTTLHVPPILQEQVAALRTFSAHGLAPTLTAVSQATARLYAPIAPVATVVANGVDVPHALPASLGEDLLFVGRMVPEKGVDLAIRVARGAGRRLLLAGRIEDEAYFQQVIASLVDGERIRYLGHLKQADVWQVMATAYATLFTPRWPEPCSLAVLESMARGTPVIGFRSGGLPEQVVDGTTGFLVAEGDLDAGMEAVARVADLRRGDCIKHVREHFSTRTMIDRYLQCYRQLLGAD